MCRSFWVPAGHNAISTNSWRTFRFSYNKKPRVITEFICIFIAVRNQLCEVTKPCYMALSGISLVRFIPELHIQFDTLPLWQCYCPSCSFCDSVTVPPAPSVTVLLSLLLRLWQCYCPSYSCCDSVTVPLTPVVTVLLSLLLLLWQCYCTSCSFCDSVTVPPAPAVTVLLSLLLLLRQCYCPPANAATVLLPLLFLLWQC